MPGSQWGVTPRQSIERESARRGRDAVVDGCIRLVDGLDADPELLVALAGPGTLRHVEDPHRPDRYWLRVWGARGLLWEWDERALPAIRGATRDEHWRVREMAAKVVARHRVGDALDDVARLRDDEVPRVRAAGSRAVAALTEAGA